MSGKRAGREHSPACATRRGRRDCTCELNLVEKIIRATCVCGNWWHERGLRDYTVGECLCVDPGDGPAYTDDQIDHRSREHTYHVDRL